jgi:hypothetical protein
MTTATNTLSGSPAAPNTTPHLRTKNDLPEAVCAAAVHRKARDNARHGTTTSVRER